jgi:hypothetical protein
MECRAATAPLFPALDFRMLRELNMDIVHDRVRMTNQPKDA